jgi:hypothetical protein
VDMQVDAIPLSRPKRNIARDFSDGGTSLDYALFPHKGLGQWYMSSLCHWHAVLVAEVVHHFFPREVQLHNYRFDNRHSLHSR